MEGGGDAAYAYFALHELHMRPSEWANLPPREKALCMVMIDRYAEERAKHTKRVKRGKT